MFPDALPPVLQQLLRHTHWQPDELGQSSARTYRIEGKETFYLKINAVDPWGGLQTEADALQWLRMWLPAPEVLHYERAAGMDYLLMRALPGRPASAPEWASNPVRLIETLADTMRALHNLDPLTCPFDQRTPAKLQQATRWVSQGLVDAYDFDAENKGRTPQQILDRLHTEQPPAADLVVTHGDFCLPNILLSDWTLSGFIDVGKLGVGDPYQDLALCTRSLLHNLHTNRHSADFFGAYGLTAVDEDRLRYFRLLDELA